MSTASATRTIKFLQKAGTYTATIVSPSGDLYQTYEGDSSNVTSIKPSFVSNDVYLQFVCLSSRTAEGVANVSDLAVYFNDVQVEFASNGYSTGDYAGYFILTSPSTNSTDYWRLQIVNDLVALAAFVNCTIKMVGTITYNSQSDTIQASYTIPIEQATGNSYKVTIAAGDTNNFVITTSSTSCILKALAYMGGELMDPVSSVLKYEWQKLTATDDTVGWVTLDGQTSQPLTVSNSDVDTYGEFRVVVTQGDNDTIIGRDIQSVIDASDPYEIDPCPDPEDETIDEDTSSNSNGTVTYEPKIVRRGSTTEAVSDVQFYFIVTDAAGNIMNPDAYQQLSDTGVVTRQMCEDAGGADLNITIISQEF